jgi:cytochrome c553
MRLPLFMCLVMIAACSSKREAPPPPAPVVAPTPPPPADAAPPDAAAPTLQDHMTGHFTVVSELERAIARGHLEEAQHLATWLGAHEEPQQEGWRPFVDELHSAALAVATAPDLPTAAALAARLGRACSKCHQARAAVVTYSWEPVPDEHPSLAAQMKRHQWAAARLWEGLVGPSDEMWNEGTAVLATAKLDAQAAAGGAPRGDVVALAAKVRELARRATKLTDQDARAELYGELLSTCAGCHQLVRPRPVPGP